jgi:hypothetical protein
MTVHIRIAAQALSLWSAARERIASTDRGEGVISTAIAVLIVAFLGVAAWVIFNGLLSTAGNNASTQVQQIGS